MSKLINILTSVTFIAMAAIPLSAIGSVAHASGSRVQVADLNLSNPRDAARFHARVNTVALHMCRFAGKPLDRQFECRKAVRQEAVAMLGEGQRLSLQYAEGATTQLASAN